MSNETSNNPINHNVFIVWDPKYNLGIPIVDEQHRGIVSTINCLYYGMQRNQGESILRSVIRIVTEYTRIHFATEENFLKACGFPDFDSHCELHNELTLRLSEIGNKSNDPQEFMLFLKRWWIDHICVKDKVFRDFLQSQKH